MTVARVLFVKFCTAGTVGRRIAKQYIPVKGLVLLPSEKNGDILDILPSLTTPSPNNERNRGNRA